MDQVWPESSLRNKNLGGFFTRQFLQSKAMVPLNDLAHASWDSTLTFARSCEHLFKPLCDTAAMEPLTHALHILAKNTHEMYKNQNWVSFLVPQLVASFASVTAPKASEDKPTDKTIYQQYKRIRQQYAKTSRLLTQAAKLSRAPGRGVIDAMRCQADFASFYMDGRIAIFQATDRRIAFSQAKEAGDINRMVETQDGVIDSLAQAKDHFIRATHAWADSIEDRCDLNVLACLNYYVVDAIKALHQLASLENHWAREP